MLASTILFGCADTMDSNKDKLISNQVAAIVDSASLENSFGNEQLSKDTNFVNDLTSGEWIQYFKNGEVSEKGFYEKGKEKGAWIYYYLTGKIAENGNFLEGEKTGK